MGDFAVGNIRIRLDTADFRQAVRALASASGKSTADVFLTSARSLVSNRRGSGLVDITPPNSQGTHGNSAKKQGEGAISRDLSRVFTGVKLQHKRSEQWPDLESIHARLFAQKRGNSPLQSDRGRGMYYVDQQKLKALYAALILRVGWLASGWNAAASRLGVPVPAWIARHGARGEARVNLQWPVYEIELTNVAPGGAPIDGLERLIPYAVEYETKAMLRQIPYVVAANAQRAGFKAAA